MFTLCAQRVCNVLSILSLQGELKSLAFDGLSTELPYDPRFMYGISVDNSSIVWIPCIHTLGGGKLQVIHRFRFWIPMVNKRGSLLVRGHTRALKKSPNDGVWETLSQRLARPISAYTSLVLVRK